MVVRDTDTMYGATITSFIVQESGLAHTSCDHVSADHSRLESRLHHLNAIVTHIVGLRQIVGFGRDEVTRCEFAFKVIHRTLSSSTTYRIFRSHGVANSVLRAIVC